MLTASASTTVTSKEFYGVDPVVVRRSHEQEKPHNTHEQ